MIWIIDNYDSFVHNLARYVREEGHETIIVRNDEATSAEILQAAPDAIIISPGPKAPEEAGVCLDLIAAAPRSLPLLGVCLGHQCLVEAHGGATARALAPLHGEASFIRHDGSGIFQDIESPMLVGRYHSLISHLPAHSPLIACAWSAEKEIMACRHRASPWWGVQFHPESLLTPEGRRLMRNFCALIDPEATA